MARCTACNRQIEFSEEFCLKCKSAINSVYDITQEDIDKIDQLLYNVNDVYMINGMYIETDESKGKRRSNIT